jgi:hypothetical protein
MPRMLQEEVDAITADRMKIARENPGFFWDDGNDGGRKLTRAEAQVFGIKYEEFPHMITVWEAWFAFLGYVERHGFGHSDEAIEGARRQYPDLAAENDPHLFAEFAITIGGLSRRQAEAMYWKDVSGSSAILYLRPRALIRLRAAVTLAAMMPKRSSPSLTWKCRRELRVGH